jgi:hypothetical protein
MGETMGGDTALITIDAGEVGKAVLDFAKTEADSIAKYIQDLAAHSSDQFFIKVEEKEIKAPRNSNLRIWVANVDDNVNIRIGGTSKSFHRGQAPQEFHHPVITPGKKLLLAELDNVGRGNYSLTLHVGFPSGRKSPTGSPLYTNIIDIEVSGNDQLAGYKRNYLCIFSVV